MTISRPAVAMQPGQGPGATAQAIFDGGLVAILRASSALHFPAITEVLVEAGIRAIEVTLTAADAFDALAALSATYADTAIIGAGTVVTADQAEACIDAGASFLVSPTASPDVIATARIASVAAFPGALTPTEMIAAAQAGAQAVKLFPASAVGPRFITDVHGPFPEIAIMPTGGISITDIGAWIDAGAAAVGLGSPLIGPAATEGADHALTARARQAVAAVTRAREAR